jgi:phage-related protein (TIGR01555 family)
MAKKREVKTADAALAMTRQPVGDGLENVVAGLGTDRDKRSYSVWADPRILTRQELENMYRGSWLAKKIVNAVADDMTREWLHVTFDGEELGTTIEQAEKRFALKRKTNEALKWSRLYGGAVIIIGTRDRNLAKPLDVKNVRKGDLRYLHVVDRWRLSPAGSLNRDLESPNFGMPDSYVLAESTVQVHHTRVLRFNGEKLPYFAWLRNAMWDDSVLQHVMDSLMNCDTTTQAIATMMFESNVDVVKSEGLADVLARKDGEAVLTKRFQVAALLKSFNRMLLLDGTESYEKKQNSFANLDKVIQQFMIDVSGAADIPMTRLFGTSATGMNATGDNDVRNYYDMVSAKQEAELRPQLEYLYEVLVRSELGHMPEDFRFDFNPLWQLSETEQATVEKTRAERDQVYLNAGVVTEALVARELKERGTYRNMTDDDIELAEELSKPMDENGEVGKTPGAKPPDGGEGGDDDEQVAGVAQGGKTAPATSGGE